MSVTMYAVQGTGSDTNSGSTTNGSPKASGTGAATTISVATVDLSADSPDLSSVNVGDTIRLNGRTDGKNLTNPGDIFEITGVDDVADTVTVTPTPGSSTSGVTWAIGGCFATLTKLFTSADKNDILYASGTFDESVDMVNTMASGDSTEPIRFIGYSAAPGDGGQVVLDSNGTKANGIILKNGNAYWSFENVKITRYTNQGFRGTFASYPFRYLNCEVSHCGAEGWYIPLTGQLLINCYSHDNDGQGFDVKEGCYLLGCIAKDNGGDGFFVDGGSVLMHCVAVGNGTTSGNGIHNNADLNHRPMVIVNCLVDGDGKTTSIGLRLVTNADNLSALVMNTIVYDCATGIASTTQDDTYFAPHLNNMVYGCTTAYSNVSGQIDSVTTQPGFEDEAGGDYTPTDGANQTKIGFGFAAQDHIAQSGDRPDIGPVQADAAAAGGGGGFSPFYPLHIPGDS